jgi:5'-3' exonuclease
MGISGFAAFVEQGFPEAITMQQVRNLNVQGRIAVDGYNESYTQMHVSKKTIIRQLTLQEVFDYFSGTGFRDELRDRIRKVWVHRILDFIITDLKRNVVWVFDGENVPVMKDEVRAERKERADKIKAEMEAFVTRYETDDFPDQASYRKVLEEYLCSKPPGFDDYRILHSILVNIGIPVVKAHGEGEKACARLCNSELTRDPTLLCQAVWSADVDSILFGAPILMQRYRSFGIIAGSKQEFSLIRVFDISKIPIPLPTLIKVCVAAGCDYLPKGVPGLGLKKAYKLYSVSPEKFPEEHHSIVQMFAHDPIEEYVHISSLPADDPLAKWFIGMYA